MNKRTAAQDAATYTVGSLVEVDPGTLVIRRNIRDASADPGLVASVKAVGVLEVINAVLGAEGELVVRQGHRRTLAAVEAGTPTVRVYIAGTEAEDTDYEVARVIEQRDENTHRVGLTTAEDLGVVETLSGLGLSAAQITKQARIKRADVDTALTVIGSPIAHKAAAKYEALTLDQAAVVAEFEDDKEAVKALIVAAHDNQLDHVAQQLRDKRTHGAALQALEAELAEAKVPVVDRPAYDDKTTLPLRRLNDANGNRIVAADHPSCPGHVAWIVQTWAHVNDAGQIVPEPDEEDYDSEEAAHDAWQQWRSTTRNVQVPAAEYGCKDFRGNGHRDSYATSSARTPVAEMSEEEREAQKKNRRVVIENNKAWSAAQPVRRAFLASVAKHNKTAPKGAARFIASAMSLDAHLIGTTGGNVVACEAFGKKRASSYGRDDLSPAKTASDGRCLTIALVQVLADFEADLNDGSWRYDGTTNSAGRYLRYLESIGYPLSAVEKFAISKKTA